MHWIVASIVSAFVLGLYELAKKHAVLGNAVLPVLFLGTVCGAAVWIALLALQGFAPEALPAALFVSDLSARGHGLLLLKSAIVAVSWTCSYFGLRHLPVSIAAPILSTGPLWTLAGALIVLGERPTMLEGAGIAITLASFLGLSAAGRLEGIDFRRNRWIACMFAGALFGGISGLYDKHLLGNLGFSAATVQAWFSIYTAVLFLPLAIGWKRRWWPRGEFRWRWSVPAIGLALLVADFIYFDALRDPDALIALVSSIRRGSTLVAFAGGVWWFRESLGRRKLPAVLGVLLGIVLTIVG